MALVVAQVVVVLDEGVDLGLEIAGQIVVLQQDAVLERLVPALDLALGLGMEGSTADMAHAPIRRAIPPGRRRCSSGRCRSAVGVDAPPGR